MDIKQNVLVTGHHGYIGSILAPALVAAGHRVVGLDNDLFRDCLVMPDTADIPSVRRDLRDLERTDVVGFDTVVHLAALSNDPIGNLNEEWTHEINLEASVRLAELAKEAGVRRFLFSSSCIMYGSAEAELVSEEAPLDPKTTYARSKVDAEKAISALADDRFSPVFLRNGTVYGLSPRMRFDTVLNDLVASALTVGEIVVHSDGTPWRPVVDVRDVARAFRAILEAPIENVHDQPLNVGADELNIRIGDLAQLVARAVQGSRVTVLAEASADQRTYRTDFGRFAGAFPSVRFRSPERGAQELAESLRQIGLDRETYADRRFTRLRWLRHLLDTGELDESLRWRRRLEAA